MSPHTRDEMMTIAAARLLWDGCVCFVGIGLPSAACNLGRVFRSLFPVQEVRAQECSEKE